MLDDPRPDEIEVTPKMKEAGVAALEEQLLEGMSIPSLRPLLVSAVYRAMSEAAQTFPPERR